jgi:branched-chain amino acid aminotransferase
VGRVSPSAPGCLASLDGEIMPAAEAQIPATDEGLLRGDGVFEVVRVYEGRPYALEEHLERMRRSAERLRLAVDLESVRAEAHRLLARAGAAPEHEALRIVLTRGGRRLLLTEPLPGHAGALSLASVTYSPTRVMDGIKSLSYAANMLATRLAAERGADEALLVTPHGRVLEAPTSTIFYVLGGQLHTPPLSEHILDSITRRAVLAVAEVSERQCTLEELYGAQEAFLASSTREVQPVSAIDGRELPGAPGPVTARVVDAVAAYVRTRL